MGTIGAMLFLIVADVDGRMEDGGWRLRRSSVGSGKVFCEDSAATCSMLTSTAPDPQVRRQQEQRFERRTFS